MTRGQLERPWDAVFARWIAEGRARARIRTTSAIGNGPIRRGISTSYYLPRLTERSVVLELGPGTGRVSRHLIGRCRELILVDYSQLVCNWLAEYLEGKGRFRIGVASVSSYQVQRTTVPAASVVYLFSDGVFEIVTRDHRRWTQSDSCRSSSSRRSPARLTWNGSTGRSDRWPSQDPWTMTSR
jgi:hypothetical protein